MLCSQRSRHLFACLCALGAMTCMPLAAQTDTTFTYQGVLNDGGQPTTGTYSVNFSLWDALAGGNEIGTANLFGTLEVDDGLFTVELDFGADAFDNSSCWLEISVGGTALVPRHLITRSPYSIQTRGIFVDANNKIGIGTTSPSARLEIRATEPDALFAATTSSTGRAVFGYAAAPTGNTYGVFGWADSAAGTGVKGFALGVAGVNYGVYGQTNSPEGYAGYFEGGRNYFQGRVGIGTASPNNALSVMSTDITSIRADNSNSSNAAEAVLGVAHSSVGSTTGVKGISLSTSGRGVYGKADATSGVNYGVIGQTRSTSGRGVQGEATATSGDAFGVSGTSSSTSGRGVSGENLASTGFTYGVHGRNNSTSGTGVYGEARESSGGNFGMYGRSYSTGGRGVYGEALASSGTTYGVHGQSKSTSGKGVYGEASALSGSTFGVLGVSESTSGRGVRGTTSATTGFTYALEGRAASTNGRGVFGYATASSGFTIGVLGKSNSAGGWDFYADGIGGNYGTGSSIRWKSNIVPIGDPLGKLAQIRGVYYDWDEAHGGFHDVGMIAEEVGEVLPEIVQYEENGIDAMGMDYSKMTPLLVEAVNALHSESNRRLAEKDDEISELRAANKDLQSRLTQIEAAVAHLAANQENQP